MAKEHIIAPQHQIDADQNNSQNIEQNKNAQNRSACRSHAEAPRSEQRSSHNTAMRDKILKKAILRKADIELGRHNRIRRADKPPEIGNLVSRLPPENQHSDNRKNSNTANMQRHILLHELVYPNRRYAIAPIQHLIERESPPQTHCR